MSATTLIELPRREDPREERNWGAPSYLDRLHDLDDAIQHTPINERATSKACQEAFSELHRMSLPRFHTCTKCGMQYGNSETYLEIKSEADVPGICPRCS